MASRLTRRERDFIKGTFAADTHDFASAQEAFHDCAIYYETDALCIFFEALPLRMMGRSREALDALNRALEVAPNFNGVYQSEAYDYILLGEMQDAAVAVGRLRQSGHTEQAAVLSGDLAFLRHDYATARTAFTSVESVRVNQDWALGYGLLARLAAEQGRYGEAMRCLDQGIDEARSHQDQESTAARLIDRAYIESRQGKLGPSLQDVDAALNIDSSPAAIIQVSAVLGYLATTAPGSDTLLAARLSTLKSKIPTAGSGVIFDLARYRVQGEWLLSTGKPEAALDQFEKADNLDATITDREYLGRALAVLANREKNSRTAQALRIKALTAYERIALHPESVWYYPQRSVPGLFADEMEDALRLSQFLPSRPDIEQMNQQYSMLCSPSGRSLIVDRGSKLSNHLNPSKEE